jgi:phage gp36-like protein
VFTGFRGVFQRKNSPAPVVRAGTRLQAPVTTPRGAFNTLETLILRLFGLPLVYTTVTRINSAFPAINSVSNINSAIICQYAEDVEAEIDAIISKRYVLPLTVTCPILVAIATRETIYRIAVQRALVQFPPAQEGRAPLAVQHADDQKLLDKIANGMIQLVGADGTVVAADTTQLEVYSTTKTYVPTFHEGAWTDMIQDQDKLDDILSDRDL